MYTHRGQREKVDLGSSDIDRPRRWHRSRNRNWNL